MSLIFGAIAGGLAGAGAAGEKAFARMHEHENQKSLEKMRADLMFEKESRLIELRHGNDLTLKRDIEQPFLAGQNKLALESAERQRREADIAAGERVGMQTVSAEKINTANLASHAKDRESREKVARISAGAATHDKPSVMTNADGTVSIINPNTGKSTLVVDSETGKPMVAKVPITKERELYINTLSGYANRIIGNSASSPEDRARAQQIIDVQIPNMLSGQKPMPDNAAMAAMKKHIDNPQARLGWEKIYGVGTIEPAMAAFDAAAAAASAKKLDPPKTPAGAPAAPGAATPGIVESATALSPAAEKLGVQLDAARQRVAAAEAVLTKFGMKQQRDKPAEFAAAKAEAKAAREERSAAQQEYEAAASREVKLPGR